MRSLLRGMMPVCGIGRCQGMPEQGHDSEPVGDPADQRRFGRGADGQHRPGRRREDKSDIDRSGGRDASGSNEFHPSQRVKLVGSNICPASGVVCAWHGLLPCEAPPHAGGLKAGRGIAGQAVQPGTRERFPGMSTTSFLPGSSKPGRGASPWPDLVYWPGCEADPGHSCGTSSNYSNACDILGS